MSDNEEPEFKRKKKKDGEGFEDKSTPHADDPGLFAWMMGIFQEGERADFFVAHQVFGRSNQHVGSVILQKQIKKDTSITSEYLVSLSNEFLEALQNETDACRRTVSFSITAHHLKATAEHIAKRTITLSPKKLHLRPEEEEGDDDSISLNGNDLLRKRVETVLQDGRFYAEHVTSSLGGMVQLMLEQLRDKDTMIKQLFDANMQLARQKNDAENNALDRELIREDKKLAIEGKRKVLNLVAGLLPDVARKFTNGVVDIPGGRAPEAMAIETVMESLTPAERSHVFGDWTDEGVRVHAGKLTEAQVRIIIGVLKEQLKAEHIDRLVDGPDAITKEQFMEIASSADPDKFIPLLKIIKDRKEHLAANPAAATEGKPIPPPTTAAKEA